MDTSIAKRQIEGVFIDSFILEEVWINIYDFSAAVATFVVHTYGRIKETLLRGKRSFTMPGSGGESNGRLFLQGETRLGQ